MNSAQEAESLLEKAVEDTPDVRGSSKKGLGAIRGVDKSKFNFSDTRKIGGSLDIDTSTRKKYPNGNRWDYAVEYDSEIFFVEIHPGMTSEVKVVLAKLEWLKWWLKNEAPLIKALKPKNKRAYYWVFTDKDAILPTSKWKKILAQTQELVYAKSISL